MRSMTSAFIEFISIIAIIASVQVASSNEPPSPRSGLVGKVQTAAEKVSHAWAKSSLERKSTHHLRQDLDKIKSRNTELSGKIGMHRINIGKIQSLLKDLPDGERKGKLEGVLSRQRQELNKNSQSKAKNEQEAHIIERILEKRKIEEAAKR